LDDISTSAVLVGVLALLAFWIVGAHNRLVRLRSETAAAWAPLAEQLRRRHTLAGELADLLATPGLDAEGAAATGVPISARVPADLVVATEAVQAAAAQARVATDHAHAHARVADAGAIQSLALAEQVLSRSLGALRRVQLAHPQWPTATAAEQVEALAQALQQTEAQIDFASRHHGAAVVALNAAVHEWPTRLVAALFGIRHAAALPALGSPEAPAPR
jgi:LemA protein